MKLSVHLGAVEETPSSLGTPEQARQPGILDLPEFVEADCYLLWHFQDLAIFHSLGRQFVGSPMTIFSTNQRAWAQRLSFHAHLG